MTDEVEKLPLEERVGFNYAQALTDLLTRMTNEELALALGYKSVGAIHEIRGPRKRKPNHPHGEALWALYMATFSRKPPMSVIQQNARQATETTLQASS